MLLDDDVIITSLLPICIHDDVYTCAGSLVSLVRDSLVMFKKVSGHQAS